MSPSYAEQLRAAESLPIRERVRLVAMLMKGIEETVQLDPGYDEVADKAFAELCAGYIDRAISMCERGISAEAARIELEAA